MANGNQNNVVILATCARCGAAFDCNPAEDCWCKAEPYRVAADPDTTQCLCPTCLRKRVAAAARR